MEAATLRRHGASPIQTLREAARARSRAFWIVAGLTALAAVLRFATLGIQSYHHDEVVTASRILRAGFGHAMSAVNFSESTPPLYYALAWVWVQVTGTGEWGLRSLSALAGVATVPVAYLLGVELRGRRAGLWTAALVAVNPMLLWYSQEARAYSLLVLFGSVSFLFTLRAMRSGARRDYLWWGLFSGLAVATHYFAIFPILAEIVLLWRRRGRASLPGLAIFIAICAALAPLAHHQMSIGHASWIGNSNLGHRLWETAAAFMTGETGDVIGRPERPWLAFAPLALSLAALGMLLLRRLRDERPAAGRALLVGGAAIAIPVALAFVSDGKDYVLARNLIPALVPLLAAVAIALSAPAARRLGAVLGGGLVAYSLGFCVLVSADEQFQRPDWDAVAARIGAPTTPRAIVTWTVGEAPLRYYLGSGATQIHASERYKWLVREIDFVSDGEVPPPPRHLIGPDFREAAHEGVGRLFVRRYRVPGPGLAPLPLRHLRDADLDWRTTGVLLDGIGPN